MKHSIRMLSILVILSFILTPLATFFSSPTSAADASSSGSDYKQKIVSVLFDDSGSMGNSEQKPGELTTWKPRLPAARYALGILISLMDSRDKLVVTTMNRGTGAELAPDLSDPSQRNAVMKSVLSSSKLTSGGVTPSESMESAISYLLGQGLKSEQDVWQSDPNKEHWLVILSDGGFDPIVGKENISSQARRIENYIKNYPLLNTVYIGFGTGAVDLKGEEGYKDITTKYRFSSYKATVAELASTMQKVANQIAGRYSFSKDDFSVNGNKVTIDLSKLEFSLASISIMAQDCGATSATATYNGKPVTLQKQCIYDPKVFDPPDSSGKQILGMSTGYSAEIRESTYLSGGTVVFELSGTVKAENLLIIAEPALRIEALLYKDQAMTQQIDVGYINSNMRAGESIYVDYVAFSQHNNEEIDLAKAFGGDVEASISYDGKSDYKVGAPIKLVLGTKDLLLTVKVLGGRYILTDSFNFVVLEKPEDFKVESAADAEFNSVTKTAKITYTIYLDGKKVTSKAQLAAYTCTATMTRPDGQTEKVTLTVNDNGTVSGAFRATVGIYGDYAVAFRIEYNDNKLVYREASDSVNFPQPVVAVTATGGGTIDPSKLESSGVFKVTENGNALTWDVLKDYTLTAVMIAPDKIETQLRYVLQQDGTVTVDMDAVEGVYGTYTVVLKVVTNYGGEAEGSYTAKYVPAAADMTVVGSDHLSIRQHALKSNELGFTFELKAGTEPFVFENGLTTLKIFVDGKEMQGIIRMNGNKMTFIPHADYLKEICDTPGDKTVVVELRCDEYPQLCDSETVTLTVEQTVFAVEVFPFGTQSIDRFRLTETTAAAYFRVLRDGAPLSVQELQEALDAGKLAWDTENMGIFNLNGLSPMRTDIAVLSDSGEADASGSAVGMIAVQVSRSCLRPLDSYVSMLVMSGNKTVTLRYEDVFVSGALTVERSGAWSYIWRVLVILFLIYLGLYIAGFFKAKAMPSGVFVRISTNGSTQSTYVNDTVWKRYGWHLLRFFQPHKLWAYQSPESQDPDCDGMKLVHTKEHPFTFMIEEGDSVYALNLVDGSPGAEMMPKLFNRLREGDEDYELKRDVRPSDVPETFEQRDEGVALREDSFATPYRWNGKYPRNGKNFLYAVYFIKF